MKNEAERGSLRAGLEELTLRSIGVGPLAWAIAIAVLLGALYYDIVTLLVTQWYRNPDYSHGFLIPFLSAYFVWERRGQLRMLRPAPTLWGVGLLGGGLLVLLIGSVGAELFLQRVSLIGVIAGLVLLVLGGKALRILAFPIAFLLFMIPLPALVMNSIAFPLQLFAARTATYSLFCLGIPVVREGNIIALAQTTLEVAEACSGIRSLQALLAVGATYAYFTQVIRWKQFALVFLTIPVAIAANAFRVSSTGILAHYWGLEIAEGFYHTFAGLMIFLVAFVLLLIAGTLLSRIGSVAAEEEARSTS